MDIKIVNQQVVIWRKKDKRKRHGKFVNSTIYIRMKKIVKNT